MKKVELLAPAGNYEAFVGAIHAGADAVYLGGNKYSARAFAENFDEETLCRAIFYAHLFDRKVYLTINTLVKQSELNELYDFLRPFYECGLDGVIVQDLGVIRALKEYFPLIEVHISTQMCITGPDSVVMMKELGASRVVPARELSLEEIRILKKEGLEIETFIHGAMCYCYSGRCFFSSFLGGRSGNRGKCAQSCRLPYQTDLDGKKKKKSRAEEYPLSLKDMCTVTGIPGLIEAGIDSLKIEGRMKRPEYAAGVTAIYRKYIDLYYEKGSCEFEVDPEDLGKLEHLYIRSELQDGYYYRFNGPEMITLEKPGYAGTDEALAASIYEKYIKNTMKAEVSGRVLLRKEEPLRLTVSFRKFEAMVEGPVASKAMKAAVTKEDVEKQIRKTGNTDFVFSKLVIEMEDDIFLPLKSLNELRRQAFRELEEKILLSRKREALCKADIVHKTGSVKDIGFPPKKLLIFVSDKAQCLAIIRHSTDVSLSVPSHLLKDQELFTHLRKASANGIKIWICMPQVVRFRDHSAVEEIIRQCKEFAEGIVVSDLETYGHITKLGFKGRIMCNHHIYTWNRKSMEFWESRADILTAPVECNLHVWKELDSSAYSYLCYGRIPMMITANCIRKTKDVCQNKNVAIDVSLIDRYQKAFPVEVNCDSCYNIIYNSVPLSLHTGVEELKGLPGSYLRLDFTTESDGQMMRIVGEYEKALRNEAYDFSFIGDFTAGHLKKGAL